MTLKIKIQLFFAIAIPVLTAVFLQFLPLTNTTGFEFSFLLSILLYISGGLIFLSKLSNKLKYFTGAVVLLFPLLISLFSNLFFSGCPVTIDVVFYIVLSVPSFYIGYCSAQIISNVQKRFHIISLLILLIIFLLGSLFEFYVRPQVYFYNIVFGYLPGTIYDENISITSILIFYRISSLLLLFLVLKLSYNFRDKKSYGFVFIIVAVSVLWIFYLKPVFGFATSEEKIKSELTQELITEHFRIYTDPDIKYDTTALKNLHEFYYEANKADLELSEDILITSFIFKNSEQKKRLFGSENADVAKPWLKQIYLDESGFLNSLKHELIHIQAGEFGNPPFDVAAGLNPSLIEGVAVALENNYDDTEIDYITYLALQNGYAVDINKLFERISFFGNLSTTSYLLSGSFLKFLLDSYGVKLLKNIYKTGDFISVYGKQIEELEIEFLSHMDQKEYENNAETAKLYFGRQPLIQKKCPRLAARIERTAWDFYRNREYRKALEKFSFVYNYVGSYSSVNGILWTQIQLNEYKSAYEFAIEELPTFKNTSYFYNLNFRIAELAILNKDSLRAVNIIDSLLSWNPSVKFYNEAVTYKLLLHNGTDFFSTYFFAELDKKLNMLLSFQENKEYFPSLIPRIIEFSQISGWETDVIKNIMQDSNLNYSREHIYAAYKLSQYYYSNNLLEESLELAKFARNNNLKIEYQSILDENYNLIIRSYKKSLK